MIHTLVGLLGLTVFLFGLILFFIEAFDENILWFIACFIPIGFVVFLMVHWKQARSGFGFALIGLIIHDGMKLIVS